ncbi:hypothetical protein [Pedobacter sp. Leaf41]|uniref:hypothetical protein n=1 Tax=Pedobacter sp. Leaf41 TaxID=1736218 RepID=UPI000AD71C1A|nr:hypothetical protein [Pedobacter sp. Leaf41]
MMSKILSKDLQSQSLTEFVQKAVLNLYGALPSIGWSELSRSDTNSPLNQFVKHLRISGARVFINNDDYFFSRAFGPISERLKGKTRRDIRKSLAFLRIRTYTNFNFRVAAGVASHGALFITKPDMIQLQLLNQCRFAKLFIYEEDILSNFHQADSVLAQNNQTDGYYVSGPNSLAFTPVNFVRNISGLSVYIIRKKVVVKSRSVF